MIKSEILIPLLNANEPEARLVAIHVRDGHLVEKDAILFTLETTKATFDVLATEAGFIRILAADGDILSVGDRIAVIVDSADEAVEVLMKNKEVQPSAPAGELRITRPARALAKQLGIDLSSLPTDQLVTETIVYASAGAATIEIPVISKLDPQKSCLVYGGGGHAKSLMEMICAAGKLSIAGIIDDSIPPGTFVLGIPVLGTRTILPALAEQGLRLAANGVGGIINIKRRVRIFELLEEYGYEFPTIFHPKSTIEPSAKVGAGVQIFANVYIGSEAILHPKSIINTSAVISHDCEIGSFSHIAPGALLAGHVQVAERTLVGMGVTTAIGIKIGAGVRIGNGAIIYADVPDKTIIPAGKVWGG